MAFNERRYYEKDDKLMIPISVQSHHSFVDDIHMFTVFICLRYS
ncbi:MAG: hypothetical protein GX328_00260 [Clostridiaceae bacterium]|nr:hypothetical protein [Clostridiaceae bacterium]